MDWSLKQHGNMANIFNKNRKRLKKLQTKIM